MKTKVLVVTTLGLLSLSAEIRADNELASMDLEQLMEMNVTTVAKRNQTFSSAAAAIYTITQEDIRRSGATNLPEVLRQSPGVEVARVNPGMWAVTARGFNGHAANKLLVLINGRSIYTPIYGGVYWDEQVPSLDDIQRIEIIRGPGASLWGANAVNGVINIITYDSEMTQGNRVTAGAGNEEKGYVRSRYGFRSGDLTGRFNVQTRNVDEARRDDSGRPSNDDYKVQQLGSRLDWRPLITDQLTFDMGYTQTHRHTDVFLPIGTRSLVENPPASIADDFDAELRNSFGARNFHLLGSWLHELRNGDSFSLQYYFEQGHRVDPLSEFNLTTSSIDVQYNVLPSDNHRITWGFGSRNSRDEIASTFAIYTEHPDEEYSTSTAFFQDEYRFLDGWTVTFGAKIEESTFEDMEHQPSLRVSWQPSSTTTFWSSVSRAVKTPSRLDRSVEFRGGITKGALEFFSATFPDLIPYVIVEGSADFKSETVYAYESGVRFQPQDEILIDVAFFINRYKDLYTFMPDMDPLNLRIFDPIYPYVGWVTRPDNISDAEAQGAELSSHYVIGTAWKLKLAYTYYNLSPSDDFTGFPASEFAEQSPMHQGYITSTLNLDDGWECDVTLRYVDAVYYGEVPAYTTVDMRVAKWLSRNFDIAIIGRDLFDEQRLEFVNRGNGPNPTELERSIYLQLSWRE